MSRTWATYIVSGAGKSQVNGTYIETEQDVYTYSVYSITKNAQTGFWEIVDVRYQNDVIYQSTDATETPDLATWIVGSHGTDPPPTVVAGTPIQGNPDIEVSGAGSSLVNGTYEHTDSNWTGKPVYTKGSERYQIVNYDLWLIFAPYTHPEYGEFDYPYYQEKQSESGSPATPDLVAEWEIYTYEGSPTAGVNPPPNVTEYTPTHDIAVDPLTVQANITQPTLEQTHELKANSLTATAGISEPTLSIAHNLTADPLVASAGITEPTLTQTHIINVEPLSASAGLTEPTLTQTHIINVDPLGMVANLTDIDFAQTHVIDIEPLWAQIELSDLTLAQYIRTPTPDCRRLTIHAEDRRLTIHAEDRTLTIPREDRTLKIKCCE